MEYISDLKKLDGEDYFHYTWRMDSLIRGGKYPNWEEITPIVNKELWGEHFEKYRGESAYRKDVASARKYLEAGVFNMSDDEMLQKYEEARRELEIERQKLYTTKVEYSRLLRQQSRFSMFYENVKNEIKIFEIPKFKPLPLFSSKKKHILTIADIHAGAKFNVGINSYSLDECVRRFETLTNHMINYVKENSISDLSILCLGDDIQGILRLSDLQLNETSVVHATVFVSKLITQFLNDLSRYCIINYYHCPTSNHSQSRNLGTKASELASEDVEYIIANYISDSLINNERITVHTNFGEEYIEIPIFGFNAIAFHGHQLQSVRAAVKDVSFSNRKFYDVLFVAHYHGGEEIVSGESENSDVETLICPAFVGTCPYAKKIMKGAKPACKIFVFDEKYGHTDTHKIILN